MLSLDRGDLILKTPYNRDLVDDLKASIPLHGRMWDPSRKVWIIAYIYGQDIIDVCERHLGITPTIPKQQTSLKPQPVVKLLRVEYIGAAKEREDGSKIAMGLCDGQWSVVFSLNCLKNWFEGGDSPTTEAATLYAILGIQKQATMGEIKRAYRIAAKTWHPDLNNDPDAADQFRRINEAYEILIDDQQRKKYNAGLFLQSQTESTTTDYESVWRPPKRCGWLTLQGQESLGRFVVDHILSWDEIIEHGKIMVSTWKMGDKHHTVNWL